MRKMKVALPEELSAEVRARVSEWQLTGKVERIWGRDASLWTGGTEASWLGWLDIVGQQGAEVESLLEFAREIQDEEFTDVVVLGNGRFEPLPRGFEPEFRPPGGLPSTADSRFDRSRSGPGASREPRPLIDSLHRLEQVGHDPRTERLLELLPGSGTPGAASRRCGPTLRRNYRPWIGTADVCRGGGLSTDLPRSTGDRWPLFCLVELRNGTRGGDGPRSGAMARPRRGDGQSLCGSRGRQGESWPPVGCADWRVPASRSRQDDDHQLTRNSRPGCLAGATGGRIHRQGRQGRDSRGPGRDRPH